MCFGLFLLYSYFSLVLSSVTANNMYVFSVYLYYNYKFFLFIIIFVVVFYCIYFIEIMYNNIQVHDVVHAQYYLKNVF